MKSKEFKTLDEQIDILKSKRRTALKGLLRDQTKRQRLIVHTKSLTERKQNLQFRFLLQIAVFVGRKTDIGQKQTAQGETQQNERNRRQRDDSFFHWPGLLSKNQMENQKRKYRNGL